MNNPLAQKAQYYLNESHRLSEELQAEEAYSELLENVLFKLLGEEDFTKLFEYVMKGSLTHDEKGNPLSAEKSARRAKRVGQIMDIGRKTWDEGDRARAAASLVAKNVNYAGPKDKEEESEVSSYTSNVGKIKGALGVRDQESTFEVKPTVANAGQGDRTPEQADADQKRLSKVARERIAATKAKLQSQPKPKPPVTQTGSNTFNFNPRND